MTILKKLGAYAVCASMIVSTLGVSAAQATSVQDQMEYNRYSCQQNKGTWRGHYCDYNNNSNSNSNDSSCGVGCVLGGIFLLGLGAAILGSSGEKKKPAN